MEKTGSEAEGAATPLWSADEAAAATGGKRSGNWTSAQGIEIDSRLVGPGDLFVALKGPNRDGHDFVADALEKGAAAALVTHRPKKLDKKAPLLIVEPDENGDTLGALRDLGRSARARARRIAAVAVTGSVGKTSTKEMLRAALEDQAATHAAVKSFNNHWGVPLTLARTPADSRYGVFEVGMNAPGEIAPLVAQIRPKAGIVTAVAPVHLEAFTAAGTGLAGIAAEKASIYGGLIEGGIAIAPADAPHFDRLAAAAKAAGAELWTFGPAGAEAKLLSVHLNGATTTVEAEFFGARTLFKIGALGAHFASNALAALLAVKAVGADPAIAALKLADWSAVDGRGARRRLALPGGGEILLVDESYNANPASMRAALATFAQSEAMTTISGAEGRRLAFLTDMLELGPDAGDLHAALAAGPWIERIDAVFTAGPAMARLHEALPQRLRGGHCADAEELAELATRVVQAGDAAMVKGSLGSRARLVARAIEALGAVDAD
ncbi:MAG: UDP-N-acetylmuramoyl-tripeptide--D-alanyl-D-alanine ligase [Pseudomonadota bacterium]